MNFLEMLNARTVTLWSGLWSAAIGTTIAAVKLAVAQIPAESISGTLVAAGGIAVVAYGLWSAGREKVTQAAFRREREAMDRLDLALEELARCRAEYARLRGQIDGEKSHVAGP